MDPPRQIDARRIVHFGAFEADLHAGELRKYGIRIKVNDQPFRVLELLLKRPGGLVTREELKQHLWPGDTYVDFDRSLNAAVKNLRGALGDSPRNPRFIETLPKRGYRFIAALEIPAEAAPGPSVSRQDDQPAVQESHSGRAEPVAARARAKTTFWRITALAACFVIALGAVTWLRETTGSPPDPSVEAGPLRFQTRPLLDLPGRLGLPALSPDGKSVAFPWRGAETSGERAQWDVYIAAIDGGTPTRVTNGPEREQWVSWSPEGQRIAFSLGWHPSRTKAPGTYVVSLLDGSETRIMDLPSSTSWTPDGKWLIGTFGKIWAVSLETREQQDVLPDDWKLNYEPAAVSPDGKTLAFGGCRRPSGMSSCDVYLRPMDGGEPRRLTFRNGAIGGLAWTPDSREIIFVMDGRMFRIPAAGGTQPGRLEFLSSDAVFGRVRFPSLARSSPNGNTRMTFVRYVRDIDIWVTDIEKEAGSPHSYRKLIDSPGVDRYPEFSPDGSKIAFYSDRLDADRALWVCDSDGSNLRQLTPSTFQASDSGGPAWSPDGLQVAFRASTPEYIAFHIYTIPLEGGFPQLITDGDDESQPAWSRDGLYIYFQTAASGQGEVWRAPSDGSSSTGMPVNETLSWSYAESPDGRFLYFCGVEKPGTGYSSLWRVPVEGGEKEEILRPFGFDSLRFREEGLYFLDPGKERRTNLLVALKLLDTETLKITEVARAIKPRRTSHLSLSPDGRLVLTSHPEPGSTEPMLVDEFR